MHLPYFIARRYLLGKKSRNAINYITGISIAVTALVTMSLVVIFSIFNGLSGLIASLYGKYDPALKISTEHGKYFDPRDASAVLAQYNDAILYTEVIEEDVLLKHGDKQFIGRIKGVGANYQKSAEIDSLIVDGKIDFANEKTPSAAVGLGLAYYLSIGLNFVTPINVYAPNPKAGPNTSPDKAFRSRLIFPTALFSAQQEIDSKLMITSISFARDVLNAGSKVSAIEIGFKKPLTEKQSAKLQKELATKLPAGLVIQNQQQQHQFLYKVMESEKWAIFLIISFILAIASFNIVGSLTMLIIDKKRDIAILQSMGASIKLIKKIFIIEGWLITGSGILIGLVTGLVICWAQQIFGFLKLQGAGNFIVSAYPVEIQPLDIIIVTLTVSVIGFSAAFYPVSRITQKFIN